MIKMKKIKTTKSAQKRIKKVTKNGLLIRRKITAQHLARRKSKRTKKTAGQNRRISISDRKIINQILPQ